MKVKHLTTVLAVFLAAFVLCTGFNFGPSLAKKHFKFPYKSAGLTEREAAAHLLNRFTYGATPGQVDSVVKMGLENWFNHQLNADLPDDSLNKRLSTYDALNYTNVDVANIFVDRGYLYNQAAKLGYVSKDSLYVAKDKKAFNAQIQAFMKVKGYRDGQELYRQFLGQKILRAAYTNNQLQEVLTDFWFNHFNVSYSKNGPGPFIPAYERDVIRPNVFGQFDQLLLATAKSPAMMHYLDNFISVAPPPPDKVVPQPVVVQPDPSMMMGADTARKVQIVQPRRRNVAGLNENYAREVMELHTLGVDGGYTQSDVTQAARVLTGWSVYPMNDFSYNSGLIKQYVKTGVEKMAEQGYVHEGDFVFIPTRHDKGKKVVLGKTFNYGDGYQEGVDLLEMLAHHPSTAKFITKKIAVRFVCDNPPQSLLDKMSKSFTDHDGDIKQVLITMVTSPEFWGKQSLREKTKSPFELAISTIRGLNADVTQPMQIYNWVSRMGQRVYYYLAPTGFPDKGTYWINTGSLLSRMNFGLDFAAQHIPGVKFNLVALNNNHEPESAEDALLTYSKLVMPERDVKKNMEHLIPLLNTPDLAAKVGDAANGKVPANAADVPVAPDNMMASNMANALTQPKLTAKDITNANNKMLAQVVGIIIGSPEYQRR
jgi:uncharacterized protein (DUF1800 family)